MTSYALRKKRCLNLITLSTDKNTDTGLQTNCTPADTKSLSNEKTDEQHPGPERSPLKELVSPHRESRSPQPQSRSPRNESRSPRNESRSPRRESRSTRRESRSPRKESRSPRRESRSPRKESRSPRRESRSPRKESRSPRRESRSPCNESKSPRRESRSTHNKSRSSSSSSSGSSSSGSSSSGSSSTGSSSSGSSSSGSSASNNKISYQREINTNECDETDQDKKVTFEDRCDDNSNILVTEDTPSSATRIISNNEENVACTTVISTTTKNLIVSYSDSSFQYSDDSENQQLAHQKFINLPDKETDFEAIVSPEQHNLEEVSDPFSCRVNLNVPNYVISPVYTDESDIDLSDDDPSYVQTIDSRNKQKNFLFSSSSGPSSSSCDSDSSNTKIVRGRKRLRDTSKWKQNKVKRLRNSGHSYTSVSKTGKKIPARCLQPPCTEKCKLECAKKIGTDTRYQLFTQYWSLNDLYQQRAYIKSSMVDIKPRYQYTNAEKPRNPNKAYYFTIDSRPIRVCKTFFKGTLNISDRLIFTTQRKINENNFLEEDLRGKHGNHKKINPELIKDIKDHINSIPRMESHYVRASTSKEYIDGGKTIKDLYDDFKKIQTQNKKETGNYINYYNVFTKEFNISFFQPKKDMCDLCLSYDNSAADQKRELKEKYDQHLEEKILCRNEKRVDRKNVTANNKVAVYDLQAVLQCPRGDSSAFYYKSKLNSYNLTVTELSKLDTELDKKGAFDAVHSYFWTESDAKRGAIEIGTCVWKYLEEIAKDAERPINIIFYSDNCAGQNKNKFIMSMYMYAVYQFNFQSITHKFLIRGHTQNEADNIHSLTEKEVSKNLKSGPIYTPVQYITLIKNSKKSKPLINVHELSYDSILDFKKLQEEWGFNYGTDESGQNVNWNDIKVLKVTKENPFLFHYKTSYKEENFKQVNVRNKRRKMKLATEIRLNAAYTQRQEISANKKKDLKELIAKGLIPSYYAGFYNSIFNI